MPSNRCGWPESATNSRELDFVAPQVDWRSERPANWRFPHWRSWAAGWVHVVLCSAPQPAAAQTNRRDRMCRCADCPARTNHPDRRMPARARTNRRSRRSRRDCRMPHSEVRLVGRGSAAGRGSATIAKDRRPRMGNQDQTASRHRLVLVIKKGSRRGALVEAAVCVGGFGAADGKYTPARRRAARNPPAEFVARCIGGFRHRTRRATGRLRHSTRRRA